MPSWIGRLLAAPVFDDEDRSRVARLLNVLLLSLIGLALLYAISVVIISFDDPRQMAQDLAVTAASVLPLFVALVLMHRGRVYIASLLLLSVLWLPITLIAIFNHGTHSAGLATGYMMVTVIASLLLGIRGGMAVAVLSILAGSFLLYAEANRLLPEPFITNNPATDWILQAIEIIVAALVLQMAIRSRDRALNLVRQLNDELEDRVSERTAQLQAANRQLQALSRLKDQFVANVSHELRTPITNLKLYHHLLAMSPAKAQSYVETVQRETTRLERIIEDLLHLSRMDQGQVVLNLSHVDLNTLVQQYIGDRRLLAESRGLTLSLDLETALPPVQADEGLLGQALSILLTNAFNYTPDGGRIKVSTHEKKDSGERWVGFSVSDSGPGISPDEQEHLFKRFYRGQVGRRSRVPGTGLGLAIVKEIVDRHQGLVEVTSQGEGGQGASFSVWLADRPAGNAHGDINSP